MLSGVAALLLVLTTALGGSVDLPDRWTKLNPNRKQQRFYNSTTRFNVCSAGRRSGKTEVAKRRGIKKACRLTRPDSWVVFAAPTHGQACQIYWNDIKKLTPDPLIAKISESAKLIKLWTGTDIQVMGMDVPERIEGRPLDHIGMDEYGNMKLEAWDAHVRPALSTINRPGTADIYGVPEGRNHYHELAEYAQYSGDEDWSYHHWKSAEILDPKEVEAARRSMDARLFRQEYEGSFESFAGRAYYSYDSTFNTASQTPYDEEAPLILCFDFNISPGVCAICQEWEYDGVNPYAAANVTAVIDEIWIDEHSNSKIIAQEIIKKYGQHGGEVHLYGDATGGAKGTAKLAGSDWDIIQAILEPHFGSNRVVNCVPKANPRERVRVNAMNSRLLSADGVVSLIVNKKKANHVAKDLDGCVTNDDGSLVKKGIYSHISDALGYYIVKKFPVQGPSLTTNSGLSY